MKYLILIIIVILASCTNTSGFVTTSKYIVRSEISIDEPGAPVHLQTGKYADSINTGEWITYIDDIDGFAIAYSADYPKNLPSSMDGMSIERAAPSCSPEVMGYPQDPMEINEDGHRTIWGKVFDDRGMGNTPSLQALCHYPPSPPGCSSIGENCDDGAGAYAFCSEKDDKRVVICISQQTDDPELAEEIFKSFRWTE